MKHKEVIAYLEVPATSLPANCLYWRISELKDEKGYKVSKRYIQRINGFVNASNHMKYKKLL